MRPMNKYRRGQLSIGRDPRCEMVVADPQVSAHHVTIQRTPQGYILTDQGSGNGTYVNGQRVQQVLLRGGETIQIGQTVLRFGTDGSVVAAPGNDAGGTTVRAPQSASQVAYLAVMVGAQEFSRVAIAAGTVLGRGPECPVDLNADALVSREHARLDCQMGQWVVSDLGSRTGTFVNGQLARQQVLRHGDEIRVGNTRLRFYLS